MKLGRPRAHDLYNEQVAWANAEIARLILGPIRHHRRCYRRGSKTRRASEHAIAWDVL